MRPKGPHKRVKCNDDINRNVDAKKERLFLWWALFLEIEEVLQDKVWLQFLLTVQNKIIPTL